MLTGVNIGDYGKGEFDDKKHEHTFLDLVKNLDKVEGINRIRISSIEPNLLKMKLLNSFLNLKLLFRIFISLTIRLRHYPEKYAKKVSF